MTTKDEALDLALEALEGIHPGNMTPMAEEYWNKAITAIKQARSAQVQELVADVYMAGSMKTNIGTNGRVVYVSTVYSEKPFVKGDKLYTTPPAAQRQWVGLTPDEYRQLEKETTVNGYNGDYCPAWDLIEAVEAKLKEKNGV